MPQLVGESRTERRGSDVYGCDTWRVRRGYPDRPGSGKVPRERTRDEEAGGIPRTAVVQSGWSFTCEVGWMRAGCGQCRRCAVIDLSDEVTRVSP